MFCAATFTRTVVVLLVCCLVVTSAAHAQNFTDIRPSPQQVAWQDLEFGVIIHFGPNTDLVGTFVALGQVSKCATPDSASPGKFVHYADLSLIAVSQPQITSH